MISLNEKKDYYILIDGQGASFAGGCIFESMEEVVEKFQDWADSDGYEDPKLIGWTIGDCLSNWVFEMKKYNGIDWVEAGDKEFDYKIIDKTNDQEKEIQRQ